MRAEAAVVVMDRLGTTKQLGVDDRGNRKRNPLGRRTVLVAHGRAAATRRGFRLAADRLAAVVVHRADVGLVVQHPGHGAGPPARESRGGHVRRFGQAQRDLPHAEMFVDVPAEDLPHDLRLGFRHLDVGRDAVTPWNPPVAVGDLPPAHFALSRAKELAATIAFRDLDALVFGDRALDLRKQARLRIIGQGLVEKDHLDAEALELFENQDLIGVLAREAIRTQDERGLERSCLGAVAQPVEARPVQTRAAVSVVHADVGIHDVVMLLTRPARERIQLRRYRALLFLALG